MMNTMTEKMNPTIKRKTISTALMTLAMRKIVKMKII
jgi:hypothetical protein